MTPQKNNNASLRALILASSRANFWSKSIRAWCQQLSSRWFQAIWKIWVKDLKPPGHPYLGDVDATSHDWPPQSSLHPSNLGLLRWWPSNKGGSISLQSGVTENWWISCGFFQCPIISTWCFIFIVHYDDFFLSLFWSCWGIYIYIHI